MTRIALLGNAGGGKSTLSRRLRDRLKLPLHSIDQLQWRPGWTPVPADELAEAHVRILGGPRWIIDGWGDFSLIAERFQKADTIVLIDYPLWRHYFWALKRQFTSIFRPRADGPEGCPLLPMTWPLLKLIRAIDRGAMPRLREYVAQLPTEKTVVWIHDLGDLQRFHREVDRQALR